MARLGSGHTPSRSKPEYWENCTVPWITLADVWQLRDGQTNVIAETKEMVSPLGLANSAAVKHPAGTVILSRTASVGFSAIMGRDMATSQDFATWTCGPRLEPRYLLHALRGMAPDLKRVATGSTHKTIYMPDIEQLRVPLPPLEEQRRIADFLDDETARIDGLLHSRRTQVELIGERLAAQAALSTGRVRLREPGATHDPVPLRRALKFVQTGSTPANLTPSSTDRTDLDRLPWYTPAALDGWFTVAPAEKTAKVESGVPIFPADSILITGIGESLGKIGHLDHTATGNQQLTALTTHSNVNSRFIAWQLWSAEPEVREWAQYSRIRIINNDSLKSFPIHLPPRREQNAAVADLDLHLSVVHKLRTSIHSFELRATERRQALITAAVTGQFDVSTASGRNVTEGVTV
ncbi:restriction endonuclease subunit S [Streptomyces krungchingensis]